MNIVGGVHSLTAKKKTFFSYILIALHLAELKTLIVPLNFIFWSIETITPYAHAGFSLLSHDFPTSNRFPQLSCVFSGVSWIRGHFSSISASLLLQ